MENCNHIVINKNRGWRGLAEAICLDDKKVLRKMIFSFSQAVWDDMLDGRMAVQDNDYYYILYFDNLDMLPKPTQQRSVLIKNFNARVTKVNKYKKAEWTKAPADDWSVIRNFQRNKNNHTTSDWNCIGIRVIPEI